MKNTLCALILATVCTVHASQVLIKESFTKADPKLWTKITILNPFSALTYTKDGVILSRNEKQQPIPGRLFDTAFDFRTASLALPKDATTFDLSLCLGTNREKFSSCGGYHGNYENRIQWLDAKDNVIQSTYYAPSLRFSFDKPGWTTLRGTIPEKAVKASVHFGFDTPDFLKDEKAILKSMVFTVGTAKEIEDVPARGGLDHTPVLLSTSPTDDSMAPVVIAISNPKSVAWKSLKTAVDGKDITLARKGSKLTYTPEAPLAKGPHFITVTLKDLGGNTDTYTCVFSIGTIRKENVMTVREDGMPLMNGKPFFMLGIACLVKQGRNNNSYDKAFEEAAAAGMNFARHWSSYNMTAKDAQEYVAAAKKHNMFISMAPTSVKNDINVVNIAKGVASQLDVDRILAWDVGDDTSGWISAQDLMAKQRAIHAVDSSRLTTQADPVGNPHGGTKDLLDKSNYTAYVHASDTFQPEIYPVGHCEPGKETPEIAAGTVPEVITNMKQIKQDWKNAGSGPKPVWPLIQYFYYNPAKSKSWNRMPTPAELRAMSYSAVIHGSHGIFWYRYAGYPNTENATRGYSDEQWKTLSGVSLEFRALYDMYCTLPVKQTQKVSIINGPKQDAAGHDSISTLLKKHDGKTYLITCNSSVKTVKASFTVPGVTDGKEYFEKRNLKLKKNTFTDEFAPYGVHVYELK